MAKRLGVSSKTFRSSITDQGIPFYRVGKRMRFDPYEVAAYIRDTEKPEKSNVILLASHKRKRKPVTSKKFAEAV